MVAPTSTYDSALRPGALGLIKEGFADAWSRRRLIGYLIRAGLKKKGSDTLLGNLWWVIDPLLQMAVYTVVVTVIFARKTEAYPLFVFAALLPWKWFESSIKDAVSSVSGSERLIKQIQFPKVILPVGSVMSGVVNFGFGMVPLFALILVYPTHAPSPYLLLIPVVAVVQLVWTLAMAIALAAINVFFRDVGNLASHVLRLWFYLSPALYSGQQIDEIIKEHPAVGFFLRLNPFAPILESYRNLIYYRTEPLWEPLAVVLVASALILCLSMLLFKRVEPSFAKVL